MDKITLSNGQIWQDGDTPTLDGLEPSNEALLRLTKEDQQLIWNTFKYDIWGDPEIEFNDDGTPIITG